MNVEWALTEKSVFVQLRNIERRVSEERERGSKKESASHDGLSHNNNFTNNLIICNRPLAPATATAGNPPNLRSTTMAQR